MRKVAGFTLIELLVVIAIIGVLSSLFMANYMEIRKKSRDAKRMADLKQIQKALEMYRQDQDPPAYPEALPTPCTKWTDAAGNKTYMPSVPGDPLGNCSSPKPYYYNRPDTLDYVLGACMETMQNKENIVDCTSYNIENCDEISDSGKCYVLTP